MNPLIKNIIAVVVGIIIGMIVNMAIVMLSVNTILPGIDPAYLELPEGSYDVLQSWHYIFPFLAHALGTLAGAFATAKMAASNHMKLALVIGAFFLLGGIMNSMQLGFPLWVNVVDWVCCYIPMAWLGWKLSKK